MNNDTYVCALMVEAMAVQATIEGMKAENQHWLQHNGHIRYGEDEFEREAAILRHLSETLRSRAS